jgi:hypothetical protein
MGRMNRTTLMMGMSLLYLTGAALPPNGPVPDHRPEAAQAETPPTKMPGKTDSNDDKSKTEPPSPIPTPPVPATVPTPIPSPAPSPADKKPDGSIPSENTPVTEPVQPPPPPQIMAEDPQAYSQCLKALTEAGATFTEKSRIDDGDGCGIDKPVEVSAILPNIALSPKGTLRCEAALELSKWVKTVVIPTAEQALPDKGKLTAVDQASTYICRKRNSASVGKISEHARGNAVDIAALSFEKGKVAMTIAQEKNPTMDGAFQRTLNASACLYFTTVLAPGSDETHMDHMHLDLIQRSHDARYCRDPDE